MFTDDDRAFIESRPLFFLATADANGRPDCSYKGGRAGFVRYRLIVERVRRCGAHRTREGHTPPIPKWKRFPEFREVLPPGDPALTEES